MMRFRRCRNWVGVAALATTQVGAWVPIGGDLPKDGPIPITLDLARTAPRGSTGNWEGAVEEAMTLWNATLQRVQLVRAPLEDAAWYENGRNEVFFDRNAYDDPFPRGVLAAAFTTRDRGEWLETDIIFNANHSWSVYRGPIVAGAPQEFRRVAIHELGHLLGLDHPDEAGQTVATIMHSTQGDIETVTSDDEAGARALYDIETRVAPVIVRQPQGTTLLQGERVRLTVLAGGRGPLRYEWRRDGQALPGFTRSVFERTAELSDDGVYTVAVSNAAGTTLSAVAAVRVRAATPPSFAAESEQRVAESGVDFTLERRLARGDQPLVFQWQKNGVAVPGATAATLKLEDVQVSDSGDFVLSAQNAAGRADSSPLRLRVAPPRPPSFRGATSIMSIGPGGSLTLHANADSPTPVSYQWQRDGVDIPGAVSDMLQITSFGPGDAGRYTVKVTNAFATVTRLVAEVSGFESTGLTVLRQPQALAVAVGERASFSVEASGGGGYQWLKNGVAIAGATDRTFTVPSAGYRDQALYAVEVTDGVRRVRSSGARLTLRPAGNLVFTKHPGSYTTVAGTTVALDGVAALLPLDGAPEGRPAIAYQWFKDGQPLPGETRAGIEFVADATRAGNYWLRAAAGAETLDSEDADVVVVKSAPLFTAHPVSRLFPELTPAQREQLRLEAVAAEVVLRRNGITASYYSRDGARMTGSPFGDPESLPGTYTYTLERGTEVQTSRPFTLDYLPNGRPVITRQPVGLSVRAGEPVVLSVGALSGSPMTYRWLQDDVFVGEESSELRIPAVAQLHTGEYVVQVRNAAGVVRSEPARVGLAELVAPVFRIEPSDVILTQAVPNELRVSTWEPGYRFQWFRDGQPLAGETSDAVRLWPERAYVGDYRVTATNGQRTATSRTARVRMPAERQAPQILTQPVAQSGTAGGNVTLSVGADGIPAPTSYQWRKDGIDVPGATDARLKLRGVTAAAAGSYSVVVRNESGAVTSLPVSVTIDADARLINLATRAAVGRGGDILIAGFVIAGREPRAVLVRGIGDQLSEFGVSGVLRDPVVSLFDARGRFLASNDDWFRTDEAMRSALAEAARQVGAFPQRSDARDGALLMTLEPGSYTAQVKGLVDTTGVALVEIYELGRPAAERLVNLSSRAVVGRGANILIPGLVLAGEKPRRLLVRAVGPGLGTFGVAGVLADPMLTVFRGNEPVAANDDWERQADPARVAAATAGAGAFALRSGSADAALVLELALGSYTVQVAGARETTGVALVEIYELR